MGAQVRVMFQVPRLRAKLKRRSVIWLASKSYPVLISIFHFWEKAKEPLRVSELVLVGVFETLLYE